MSLLAKNTPAIDGPDSLSQRKQWRRLDPAGNSVKWQLVAWFLSQSLGMDLFVSKPEV